MTLAPESGVVLRVGVNIDLGRPWSPLLRSEADPSNLSNRAVEDHRREGIPSGDTIRCFAEESPPAARSIASNYLRLRQARVAARRWLQDDRYRSSGLVVASRSDCRDAAGGRFSDLFVVPQSVGTERQSHLFRNGADVGSKGGSARQSRCLRPRRVRLLRGVSSSQTRCGGPFHL